MGDSTPLRYKQELDVPQKVPNNSAMLDMILPSVIEAIARQSIPQMTLDLGGVKEKQNSSWVHINGWIIGLCSGLGVILVGVTLGIALFVLRSIDEEKSEGAISDVESSDDAAVEYEDDEEEVAEEREVVSASWSYSFPE